MASQPQPVTAADPLADLPEADFAGSRRRLAGWQAYLVTQFAVAFTLFHLVVLNLYPIDPWLLRAIHVSAASVLIFALYDIGRGGRDRIPWWDWVAMAAAVACAVYVYVELDGLLFRAGAIYTPGDVILGVAGTLIAL